MLNTVFLDFRFYDTKKLFAANTAIKQPAIWFGKEKTVPAGVFKDIYVTLPAGQIDKIKTQVTTLNNLKAPLPKGTPVGNITLTLNNKVYASQPLVALQDVPKGGFFSRMKDHITYLFHKMLYRSA